MGLAGRDREVAAVEAFLDGREDGARILLLEGEAGIGKTTLWRAGVAAAREHGFTVLASTAAEAEAQLSFTVVRDVLDAAFDEVADELPTPQRQALAVTLLREEPPALPLEPAAIALAFTRALRLLGERNRLLVAVDDVQWLDAASAAVLAYALRRIDQGSLLALLARRSQQVDLLGVARLEPATIELGALSVGAIGRILHDELGVAYARPTLHRLADAAGGNPFFALELARTLADHGASLVPGAPLPVPPTLHELVTGRLAALPQETLDLLVYAAAVSRPLQATIAAAAEVDLGSRLEPALAARIVTAQADEIRFVHPLFAAGTYNLAEPAHRRHVHHRLAAVAAEVEERARHLALSAETPDEDVAATLETAATRTRVRGDRVVAAQLFQDAARLTPEAEIAGRARRLLAGAGALFEAGDSERARTLLERILADGTSGDLAAEARWRLGTVLAETGNRDESMRLWEEALALAQDPELAADIQRSMAVALIYAGDGDAAVAHAEGAVAAAEASTKAEPLAFALSTRALAAVVAGDSAYRSFVERARALESTLEIACSAWTPSAVAAECALLTLDVDAAERGMSVVLDESVATGNAEMELWAAQRIAAARFAAGNIDATRELVPVVVELAETTGVMRLPAARMSAEVDAHSGNVDEPLARLERGVTDAEEQGWARHLWAARIALGALHLAGGDPAAAATELLAAREIAVASGMRNAATVIPLVDEVEAAAGADRLDQARDALAAAQALPDLPAVVEPLLLRAEAVLHAAAGELDEAEALLQRAAAHEAASTLRLQQARSLLALGSVQRRLRQRRAARETLTRARALCAELGSELWAAKVDREAARIGGRARSEGELTATELRIAELVAEGKKNREVAAILVVTDRTVESALTRIYQKLDVRSRTELARKLAQAG
jgi:DNA-binding NarL/FixJ family response regulator